MSKYRGRHTTLVPLAREACAAVMKAGGQASPGIISQARTSPGVVKLVPRTGCVTMLVKQAGAVQEVAVFGIDMLATARALRGADIGICFK